MKKTVTKYLYLYVLGITFLAFLVTLINHYVIVLVSHSTVTTLLAIFFSSFALAIIITVGITAFDPVMWELISMSRRIHRFENLSNPLLLKLSSTAPGTYHHSVNVSNLAQKAAKAIGADSLLVRTAAYYHDIGKINNPAIYVENNSEKVLTDELIGAELQEMAKMIISHVSAGVDIANKNHLPEDIIDLISQHHGTTRVQYFYNKAKEQGLKVARADFRYPGPKPLTKEAVILMLADSVEAYARALPKINPESIKMVIENTIKDKLSDNQLSNVSLSDSDLSKIKVSLAETLDSIYHQRIEYKNGKH